jgi:hypothetical protein
MATEAQGGAVRARGWLLGALGIALVALVAYWMWPEQPAVPDAVASNRRAAPRAASGAADIDPAELKVRLDALEAKRPDFGEGSRNPFRFQPPPAPPPPERLPPVSLPGPAGPPPAPAAPAIPPIPLKYMGTVERPGLMLAALTDCKGFSYAAREGELVDGRYRLVKIGIESVILEYPNGTGRTTVRKSGDCPK